MLRLAASSAFVVALLVSHAPIAAQSTAAQSTAPSTASITDADVQRLRQALADATSEIERVKPRDAATSSRLSRELDDPRVLDDPDRIVGHVFLPQNRSSVVSPG